MTAGFHLYYIVALLIYPAGLAIVYWLIRLAVRHAIADADKRRAKDHGPDVSSAADR